MNKLIYKGNLNDFDIFAGLGIVKGNWNERALKYLHYLGATSSGLNTAQKQIEEANLETLRLDFVNQDYAVGSADTGAVETKDTFDNILTFSRGSTGTYFDSAGVLQTAAVDEPRFTHDPDTLEAEGLLLEEQRTNLLTYSVPDAPEPSDWTDFVAGSPGKTLATLENGIEGIRFQSSSDRPRISQNVSCSGSTVYTASVYVDPGWSTGSPDDQILRLISNGTSAPDARATLDDVGPESRVSLSITTPSDATTLTVQYGPGISDNVSGHDVTMGGVQLEQGSFPTSYIKTEASQVTRSADNCSRTLGSEFNVSEGTLFLEVLNDEMLFNGLENATIFSIGESGHDVTSPFLSLYASGSTPSTAVLRYLGGSQGAITSPDMSGTYKIAVKYDQSTAEIYINGSFRESIAKGAGTDSPEELLIGYGRIGGFLDAILSKINYFPRALSATELQELTS